MNETSNGRSSTAGRSRRVAAIYARVSSDRQRREQTIASHTAALRELAAPAKATAITRSKLPAGATSSNMSRVRMMRKTTP